MPGEVRIGGHDPVKSDLGRMLRNRDINVSGFDIVDHRSGRIERNNFDLSFGVGLFDSISGTGGRK